VGKIVETLGAQLLATPIEKGLQEAGALLAELVEPDAYVGEVFSLGYDSALVQVHDFHRRQVGGIPALSFLIATRILPENPVDPRLEDSSVILLRVLDHAELPNAAEALRVRVETAQQVSGELEKNWDHRDVMDPTTAHVLSYAGVRCRVVGTFFVADRGDEAESRFALSFGSDISNYYPNRGLKVFKPRAQVLQRIVNYRDADNQDGGRIVGIGSIRYASTHRPFQQIGSVEFGITPTDLLGQKTALFGMTRTGKSNTTKIMLKSIFALRWNEQDPRRIGQLVFDPNGEYANENVQDASNNLEPAAIKNVWACGPRDSHEILRKDVETFGITPHPNDPGRHLMLLNFFLDQNLQIGKEIIDGALAGDGTKYISNYRDVSFEKPAQGDRSAEIRYRRRVLCHRALLYKAGFDPPSNLTPNTKGLFGKPLLEAMSKSNSDKANDYATAATILGKTNPSWAEIAQACAILRELVLPTISWLTWRGV
jgi:hypothetical protein